MGPEVEKGESGRCSLADACLLEEDSRYSLFEPSFVCIWGGRVSSSSPFSGVEGALIEVEESRGFDAFLKESRGKLNVSPLRVYSAEGRGGQMGVGDSVLLEEGRDERVEKEGEDEESWRYSCLARFCQCLGMASEGFESEILKLLNRIRERRDRSERVNGKKRKRQTFEI